MIGVGCFAHGEHVVPVPIENHHVHPLPRGGNPAAPGILLCANAHGLVHALLDDIERVAITSPYATVHEVVRLLADNVWAGYPGRIRIIAYRGWQAYGLSFLNRRLVGQHRLWDSAGRSRTPGMPAYGETGRALALPRRLRRQITAL
jgi:hypothetical protein